MILILRVEVISLLSKMREVKLNVSKQTVARKVTTYTT